jgi:hypothetical protein
MTWAMREGRGEIRIVQGDRTCCRSASAKGTSRSITAPAGDAAVGGRALGDGGGIALGAEAGDGDRALADRIDLAVGAHERGHEQGAALQALGVADGGDGEVDARALARERRQGGVTMTAATFFGLKFSPRMLTPSARACR